MESIIRQFYEIPGKIISLKSGEYLFHEGETAKYFYFVRSGQIFIMKYAESGRVLSLRLASKGSIIGELPLYEETRLIFLMRSLKFRQKFTRLNFRRSMIILKKNLRWRLVF